MKRSSWEGKNTKSVRAVLPIGLTLVPLILLLGRQILRQVTKEGVCWTRIRRRISQRWGPGHDPKYIEIAIRLDGLTTPITVL